MIRLLFLVFSISLGGCEVEKSIKPQRESHSVTDPGSPAMLTLVGYNYTDREIAQFSVDGASGGNIHVSGPNGGGGGSACCVRHLSADEKKYYKIRWHASSCRYGETASGPHYSYDLHRFYRELDIPVDKEPSNTPSYFEVHFFPNGTVSARITAEASAPILSLPRDRKAKPSPRCPNNVEPKISIG